VAIGGVLRDVVAALGSRDLLPHALSSAASSYQFVYSIEVMLLLATLVVMAPLIRQSVAMAPLEAR